MALRNLGIEHEVVGIMEIDKFAIKSYEAIHGEVNNLGDISKVKAEDVPDHDLFTYSFPCQDISVAGHGKGLSEGSGTRSGLLWECERIIEEKKPKYLLMENVKNLVGKRFKSDFDKWLERLEELGYSNYWQVLNAKDYGIPQNRERVFVVSIFGEHEPYVFPKPIKLEKRLKDVLEDEVDEKYYLNNEKAEQLIVTITKENNITKPTVVDATINEPKTKEIMNTITASYDAGIQNYKSIGGAVIEPERILGIFDKDGKKHQAGSIWDKEQLSPTLDTMQGGWRQPSVLIKNATKKGYIEASEGNGIDLSFPESKTRRGRVQKEISQTLDIGDAKGVLIGASRGRNPENPSDRTVGVKTEQRLEINKNGTSNTLTSVQKDNLVVEPIGTLAAHNSNKFGSGYMDGVSKTLKAEKHDISVVNSDYRIRKLTPLECCDLWVVVMKISTKHKK